MDAVRASAVQDRELDLADLVRRVTDDRFGATVTFTGIVRDHDRGRHVVAIEYEAHPSANEVLEQVARDIVAAHPECAVAVAHRIGFLPVGEVALAAAVSAAHRGEAFSATTELVDLVKERLPVWKRQIFADGTDEWTGSA